MTVARAATTLSNSLRINLTQLGLLKVLRIMFQVIVMCKHKGRSLQASSNTSSWSRRFIKRSAKHSFHCLACNRFCESCFHIKYHVIPLINDWLVIKVKFSNIWWSHCVETICDCSVSTSRVTNSFSPQWLVCISLLLSVVSLENNLILKFFDSSF